MSEILLTLVVRLKVNKTPTVMAKITLINEKNGLGRNYFYIVHFYRTSWSIFER